MSEVASEVTPLRREIGRLGVAAIAMNGVIGSGIFALPAFAVAQLGVFSPWAFTICAMLILTVALTFARLASFFETTGGPIVYTTTAFGSYIGFQTGLLIYVSRVAAIAASANLIVDHAAAAWHLLSDGPVRAVAVITYIAFATALNAVGVRVGMIAILAISALKLAPLFLLIAFGIPEIDWAGTVAAEVPKLGQLGETTLVLMYAFIGFEFSLINAGETRDARSNIPRALVGTVVAVAICYILIQLVVVSVAPDIGSSETPLVEIASRLMGPTGAILLSLGVVFSVGGGTMTSLLTAPRLTYALAQERSLPSALAHVNPTTGAPVWSILLCGGLSIALAVGNQFVWLATISTFVRLVTYLMCIAALPVVEKKLGGSAGRFPLIGGFSVPLIAATLTAWLLVQSSLSAITIALLIVLTGSPIYILCRRRSKTSKG